MADQVTLREVQDDDLQVFFEQQTDRIAYEMVAFTKRDPQDRDAFLSHWGTVRIDTSVMIRTIVVAGRVAGNVGRFDNAGRTDVGYWIGNEFWGRGIASAALSQFLTEVTIRPLFAGVACDNHASMRVLTKCGFEIVARETSFAKARRQEIEEVIFRLD